MNTIVTDRFSVESVSLGIGVSRAVAPWIGMDLASKVDIAATSTLSIKKADAMLARLLTVVNAEKCKAAKRRNLDG